MLKGNTHRQRGYEQLHGDSSESPQEMHRECAGSVHRVILGEEKKGVHQTPPSFRVCAGKSSNKYKACLAPNSKVSPEQTFLSLCLQCVRYFISIFRSNPSKTEAKKVSDQKGEHESGRLSRLLGC